MSMPRHGVQIDREGSAFLLDPVRDTHAALVVAACALFAAVSQAVALAVRVDFVHVALLGAGLLASMVATLAVWAIPLSVRDACAVCARGDNNSARAECEDSAGAGAGAGAGASV